MRRAMVNTVALQRPMTLRQLFYALTVQGIVDKTEQSYAMVGHQLLKLRREGVIPWADISDNTRWVRRPRTYHGVEHALRLTVETYRRSVFSQVEERVEVWCEKDALAGIIMDVTQVYDVPLYVSRGLCVGLLPARSRRGHLRRRSPVRHLRVRGPRPERGSRQRRHATQAVHLHRRDRGGVRLRRERDLHPHGGHSGADPHPWLAKQADQARGQLPRDRVRGRQRRVGCVAAG